MKTAFKIEDIKFIIFNDGSYLQYTLTMKNNEEFNLKVYNINANSKNKKDKCFKVFESNYHISNSTINYDINDTIVFINENNKYKIYCTKYQLLKNLSKL